MTPPSTPKRLVVAINRSARFGANRNVGDVVVARLREAGHDVVDLVEASFQELIVSATRAIATEPDAFVIVGGDGMVNLGTNLVAGTGVPLGLIPAGTGNDMARSLGIPHENQSAALDVLLDALERPARLIDAGYATAADGTVRWFGCMLSAGFDAVVTERANTWTRPKGKSRYTLAMLRELITLKPISYRITLDDGETRVTNAVLVSVGNGESLGGGMRVTPDALLDDGELDVLIVDSMSRSSFLRIFPRVFAGTHLTDPRVNVTRAKRIRLDADAVIAYGDGERLGPLPIDIEVRPGALAVLAPAVLPTPGERAVAAAQS